MKDLTAVEFLESIVKLDSMNPPGNELPVAEQVKSLLDSHSIENEVFKFDDNRGNLVAWLRGEGDPNDPNRKVLGLSGHMDTVPVGEVEWEHGPFSAKQVDGKMYGRGTCDMKGGLTALLYAMIELKNEGVKLNGDVKLLACAGEEAGAVGAKRLYKEGQMKDVDALIIAEPTNDEICISEKGVLWLEITTFGKTAHGSTPQFGVNAINHMHRLLSALYDNFEMDVEADWLLGKPTYNVSVIKGGVGTNVVPDQCSVQIDIRTIPGQSHDEIFAQIEGIFNDVKAEVEDLQFEMKRINDLRAVETKPENDFVQMFKEEATSFFGKEKEFQGMIPYTDGAALIAEDDDVPLVIYGSADTKLAHQPNEYIEIDPFLKSIELYKQIIKKYLA